MKDMSQEHPSLVVGQFLLDEGSDDAPHRPLQRLPFWVRALFQGPLGQRIGDIAHGALPPVPATDLPELGVHRDSMAPGGEAALVPEVVELGSDSAGPGARCHNTRSRRPGACANPPGQEEPSQQWVARQQADGTSE